MQSCSETTTVGRSTTRLPDASALRPSLASWSVLSRLYSTDQIPPLSALGQRSPRVNGETAPGAASVQPCSGDHRPSHPLRRPSGPPVPAPRHTRPREAWLRLAVRWYGSCLRACAWREDAMEACLVVTASIAVLTGLVGLAHGLLPRRRTRPHRPRLSIGSDVSRGARQRIVRRSHWPRHRREYHATRHRREAPKKGATAFGTTDRVRRAGPGSAGAALCRRHPRERQLDQRAPIRRCARHLRA